jgi:hypothetical protein
MTFEWRVLKVTVPAAGTPVAASANPLFTKAVKIRALPGNTGNVFFGGSDYDAAHRSQLAAGVNVEMYEVAALLNSQLDLSLIKVDAAVNGEGVEIHYLVQVG